MTTVIKKVSRRGLLAAAIMLLLILVCYSLANAATQTVPLSCDKDNINDHIDDIDATINADPKDTPTDFVLEAGCTFGASATIVPSNGDEVTCAVAPTFKPLPLTPGSDTTKDYTAYDPTTSCTVAGNASVENVFRPIGKGGTLATVRFEGIKITGGHYTGSTGTGAAIAEGSMTATSYHYGIEVMDNGAAGILSAKGTFERVELTDNTNDLTALGIIGSGMKARDEVEVKNSYVHETQGNGIWCDNSCHDSAINRFWVHENLVVRNGRAGIRYENVGDSSSDALIENNEVHGNSPDERRGAISVRDAQNAIIRYNHFGDVTIAGVKYPANDRNVAIIASDSGRSSRPDLKNISITNNDLTGDTITETIKGCGGTVTCSNNK